MLHIYITFEIQNEWIKHYKTVWNWDVRTKSPYYTLKYDIEYNDFISIFGFNSLGYNVLHLYDDGDDAILTILNITNYTVKCYYSLFNQYIYIHFENIKYTPKLFYPSPLNILTTDKYKDIVITCVDNN